MSIWKLRQECQTRTHVLEFLVIFSNPQISPQIVVDMFDKVDLSLYWLKIYKHLGNECNFL